MPQSSYPYKKSSESRGRMRRGDSSRRRKNRSRERRRSFSGLRRTSARHSRSRSRRRRSRTRRRNSRSPPELHSRSKRPFHLQSRVRSQRVSHSQRRQRFLQRRMKSTVPFKGPSPGFLRDTSPQPRVRLRDASPRPRLKVHGQGLRGHRGGRRSRNRRRFHKDNQETGPRVGGRRRFRAVPRRGRRRFRESSDSLSHSPRGRRPMARKRDTRGRRPLTAVRPSFGPRSSESSKLLSLRKESNQLDVDLQRCTSKLSRDLADATQCLTALRKPLPLRSDGFDDGSRKWNERMEMDETSDGSHQTPSSRRIYGLASSKTSRRRVDASQRVGAHSRSRSRSGGRRRRRPRVKLCLSEDGENSSKHKAIDCGHADSGNEAEIGTVFADTKANDSVMHASTSGSLREPRPALDSSYTTTTTRRRKPRIRTVFGMLQSHLRKAKLELAEEKTNSSSSSPPPSPPTTVSVTAKTEESGKVNGIKESVSVVLSLDTATECHSAATDMSLPTTTITTATKEQKPAIGTEKPEECESKGHASVGEIECDERIVSSTVTGAVDGSGTESVSVTLKRRSGKDIEIEARRIAQARHREIMEETRKWRQRHMECVTANLRSLQQVVCWLQWRRQVLKSRGEVNAYYRNLSADGFLVAFDFDTENANAKKPTKQSAKDQGENEGMNAAVDTVMVDGTDKVGSGQSECGREPMEEDTTEERAVGSSSTLRRVATKGKGSEGILLSQQKFVMWKPNARFRREMRDKYKALETKTRTMLESRCRAHERALAVELDSVSSPRIRQALSSCRQSSGPQLEPSLKRFFADSVLCPSHSTASSKALDEMSEADIKALTGKVSRLLKSRTLMDSLVKEHFKEVKD